MSSRAAVSSILVLCALVLAVALLQQDKPATLNLMKLRSMPLGQQMLLETQQQSPSAAVAPASASPVEKPQIAASLSDLIRRLPKAELHIHIEGTLEAAMMMQFAARNNVTMPYKSVEEAQAARENFVDLQSFLDAYQLALTSLVTQQDFYELAAAYLEKAAANNITHAEIFFDVQSHVRRGVPVSTIVNGLQTAITERASHPTAPVDASLILCLVRELGEAAAAATLALTLPYLPAINALGLASNEVGYPPEQYKQVYTAAGLLGLHKVAHAGEEGGPDYVWGALKTLGAQRIDHGVHALDDPTLVDYMAQHQVPITLCPVSNSKLKVYGGGTQLKAKLCEMLVSEIPVTINSDDPAFFGAYLNGNYEFIAEVANLDEEAIVHLARNSFTASFISKEQKEAAHEKINQVLEDWKKEQQQQQRVVSA